MDDFQQLEFFHANEAVAPQVVFQEPELDARLRSIHENAVHRAKTYLAAEAELLESIIEIDRHQIFEKFGETHLTPYCVKYLGLTSDVAANFIRVARRSVDVPELKEAVCMGHLTVTKAKAIASVITPQNKKSWIEKAKNLSKERLEAEVAKIALKASKPEKAKAVSAESFRVEYELGKEEMEMLRRAQEIVSQCFGKSAVSASLYGS